MSVHTRQSLLVFPIAHNTAGQSSCRVTPVLGCEVWRLFCSYGIVPRLRRPPAPGPRLLPPSPTSHQAATVWAAVKGRARYYPSIGNLPQQDVDGHTNTCLGVAQCDQAVTSTPGALGHSLPPLCSCSSPGAGAAHRHGQAPGGLLVPVSTQADPPPV